MHRPARWPLLFAAAVLVALAMQAGVASAAPAEPTLGLAALQTKLEAAPGNTLSGYFKTVVKGATIVQIPCDVLATTGGPASNSARIMFEAKGPLIEKYGGIVSGMSGSPLYVSDGGTDKLVGAVAYGDYFTLSGTGLATPIELMEGVEAQFGDAVLPLSRPVLIGARAITSVQVPSAERITSFGAAGTFVARPLASVYIGGLRPGTKMYAAAARSFTERGIEVVPLSAQLASGEAMVGGAPFSTDLVGGASVGVLIARGDLWAGGFGTVTYANDGTVMAFGHPAYWSGPTQMYMTNIWVDGVWPSSYFPYKIGRPGATRGLIVQDRTPGVMGRLGAVGAETLITAEATDLDTGRTATSTVSMPRAISADFGSLAAPAAYVAGSLLYDLPSVKGSAHTTTTIVVTDGTDTFTVRIVNVFDDGYSVDYLAVTDIMSAISELQSVVNDGIGSMQIVSVDFKVAFQARRSLSTIVGIDVPGGVRTGENRVRVSLLRFGVPETQTVETTVTIPPGMPLTGTFQATCPDRPSGSGMFPGEGGGTVIVIGMPEDMSRVTLPDIVRRLNMTEPNDLLTVTYSLGVASGDGGSFDLRDIFGLSATPAVTSVATTLPLPWALRGAAEARATGITLSVPSASNYGGPCVIGGKLTGVEEGLVSVYGRQAGEVEERLLATATATATEDGGEEPTESGEIPVTFSVVLRGLTRNTALRVRYEGEDGFTSAEATALAKVRARVTASASSSWLRYGRRVTLAASVLPTSTAGGTVTFQYLRNGVWRAIATRRLVSGVGAARASVSWTPPRGTWKWRVSYAAGRTSAAAVSSQKSIVVR